MMLDWMMTEGYGKRKGEVQQREEWQRRTVKPACRRQRTRRETYRNTETERETARHTESGKDRQPDTERE